MAPDASRSRLERESFLQTLEDRRSHEGETLRKEIRTETKPKRGAFPRGGEGGATHGEGELGAVAEPAVVWTVHWGLSGEPGVKLAHVLL